MALRHAGSSHRLKLRRALEHLTALETAVQVWTETNPCTIVAECEVETRKHIFRAWVGHQPNDPDIPLLAGDCIHCLRQALDHLAYKLAVRVSGSDPPPNESSTEFPIMGKDAHQLDSVLPQKIGVKKKMPPGMYAALERLQPYHGGNLELLGVLHRLDNLDKHRFPPVVAGVLAGLATNIGTLTVSSLYGPRLGVLEDGAQIMEFVPIPKTKMEVDFDHACTVTIDKGSPVAGGQPVVSLLNSIRDLIRLRVFPALEPFI